MIKDLKKFQIKLTPFQATKNWELDNVYNEGVLLLEQTASGGGDLAVALEFLDYGDGSDDPVTGSSCNIALEQQDSDRLHYKEGQKVSGIFYPELDPQNIDGTYKRVVYSQYKTAFYNDYRNPTEMWGIENIDFELSKTKRYLSENMQVFEVPQIVYGDKVVPNTVKMYNREKDDEYSIADDGYGNLTVLDTIFSRIQEIGQFGNSFSEGSSSFCDSYFFPTTSAAPSGSITLIVTSGSAIVDWFTSISNENYYSLHRSINGTNYSELTTSLAGITVYTDTTVTSSLGGATYWYKVAAVNTLGTSSFSNTASITFTITPEPQPALTCVPPPFQAYILSQSISAPYII